MGGKRGRLITEKDRSQAIILINEASNNGARRFKACEILDISLRTFERWRKERGVKDKRKGAEKFVRNKLSQEEREKVISTVNSEEYRDLPPCKIVPLLASSGKYISIPSLLPPIQHTSEQVDISSKKVFIPSFPYNVVTVFCHNKSK